MCSLRMSGFSAMIAGEGEGASKTMTTPWSVGEEVPVAPAESAEPTSAMLGDVLHVVWSHNRMLHHAWRDAEGWSQPTPVAYGEQPALAAAGERLHCLFSAQFMRNYEIYHVAWDGVRWSLPVNVSSTYGVSRHPVLAAGSDGVLHAAWADTTPGYSTIYYGTRGATFWANRPVPSGRGIMPAIAVAPDGAVYIAWSDRRSDTGAYDVYCALYRDNIWYPPESVSDSATADSLYPQLAIDARGVCHIIWSEDNGETCRIYHADRRPQGWAKPTDVSQADADLGLARLAINPFGFVHVFWSDGATIHHRIKPQAFDAAWRSSELVTPNFAEPSALSPALSASRRAHVVWCGRDAAGSCRLFHVERTPFPSPSVFLPIVFR